MVSEEFCSRRVKPLHGGSNTDRETAHLKSSDITSSIHEHLHSYSFKTSPLVLDSFPGLYISLETNDMNN